MFNLILHPFIQLNVLHTHLVIVLGDGGDAKVYPAFTTWKETIV